MRVLTLRHNEFLEAVDALAGRVAHRPDYVVAILEGGGYVGRRMAEAFELGSDHYFEVDLKRPSSSGKQGAMARALKRLPVWLLDALRIAEARVLALVPDSGRRDVRLPAELVDAAQKGGRFLVVDDAVDSGATLRAVVDAIRQAGSLAREGRECAVESAVVTVTTSRPLIRPEYCLYDNHTLIRFPWSKDAR